MGDGFCDSIGNDCTGVFPASELPKVFTVDAESLIQQVQRNVVQLADRSNANLQELLFRLLANAPDF